MYGILAIVGVMMALIILFMVQAYRTLGDRNPNDLFWYAWKTLGATGIMVGAIEYGIRHKIGGQAVYDSMFQIHAIFAATYFATLLLLIAKKHHRNFYINVASFAGLLVFGTPMLGRFLN